MTKPLTLVNINGCVDNTSTLFANASNANVVIVFIVIMFFVYDPYPHSSGSSAITFLGVIEPTRRILC